MNYGWRERISGAVILVALGAIFVPMLFDDPEPRQQGPEPVMVIEQPVDGGEARQRIIEAPQPPASVAQRDSSGDTGAVPEPDTRAQLGGGADSFGQGAGAGQSSGSGSGSGADNTGGGSQATQPRTDPIAELAQSDTSQPAKRQAPAAQPAPAKPEPAPSTPTRTAASKDGGWVVQVGSFGQKDNATGREGARRTQAVRQPVGTLDSQTG